MNLDDGAVGRLGEAVREVGIASTRYRLGELIGSGGMGAVYRAYDRVLEREIAIKLLRDAATGVGMAARMDQEAKILAALDHPGLIPVHDAGTLDDGRPFYVMRLVRGERLDQHLARGLGLAERLRLFLKICEPIAFAHAARVIHRDLKPANIMVGPFGEVQVLDWGIAKVRGAGETPIGSGVAAPPGTTDAGVVLGTTGFMAPEQASGDPSLADERADVFALGAILREMLSGDQPVPGPLAAIRDRAMAPRREDRYQSVGELTADVARFLDGAPVAAYRENLLERVARLAARHRTAIGLIAAYLLMRLVLLLF